MTPASRLRVSLALVAALAAACVPDGRDEGVSGGGGDPGPSVRPPSAAPGGGPVEALGPTVVAAVAPPPISGGTLLITRDGKAALAADPDSDAVFLGDLVNTKLLARVDLQAGDEPGRAAEDINGQLLVVLRRGGALAVINRTGALERRVPVCPAPRGIAVATKVGASAVYVACAGGELVMLEAGSLAEIRRTQLDRDLRDVVVSGGHLFVSRFRAAEVLVLATTDLSVIERRRAPGSSMANRPLGDLGGKRGPSEDPNLGLRAAEPGVAWRMRPLPGGGAMMIHQESTNGELGLEEGGYGGGLCGGPMGSAVAEFSDSGAGGAVTSGRISATLPVDFDVSSDRRRVALLSLGERGRADRGIALTTRTFLYQDFGCGSPPPITGTDEPIEFRAPAGDPIALAFDPAGRLIVQTREPARIEIVTHRGGTIPLHADSHADTGHRIFHMSTGAGLSCAGCHPEGGDDGRVWRFAQLGTRRTQNLRGGIAMTAPFHWDGQMRDMTQLMNEVFTSRMRGPRLEGEQVRALAGWMDRIPAIPASISADTDSIKRGEALFNDAKVACATCHRGAMFTDSTNRLVGTGAMMQVPALRGLAFRAPFMHDGCAKTLMDRFNGTCGGGDQHGVTSHLDPGQLTDLVHYLESL